MTDVAIVVDGPRERWRQVRREVVGVDLSISHTGMAHENGCEVVRTDTTQHLDERIADIAAWITQHTKYNGNVLVVIEDFVVRSPAASVLGMLHGVVRNQLYETNVPYALIAPATLKKFATGRGNADKADLRMALFKRTGVDEPDDNIVDACWLRFAGLWHLGRPVFDLPLDQLAALDVVKWPEGP